MCLYFVRISHFTDNYFFLILYSSGILHLLNRGNDGYIYVQAGKNNCGIALEATVTSK